MRRRRLSVVIVFVFVFVFVFIIINQQRRGGCELQRACRVHLQQRTSIFQCCALLFPRGLLFRGFLLVTSSRRILFRIRGTIQFQRTRALLKRCTARRGHPLWQRHDQRGRGV
nr:virus attachment protein p12 family [uncultured bacterium]